MIFALFILIVVLGAIIALLSIPALRGWRTTIFGGAVTVIGGILPLANQIFGYLQGLDWQQYIDPKYAPFAMLGIGLMVVILRFATTGPVGEK